MTKRNSKAQQEHAHHAANLEEGGAEMTDDKDPRPPGGPPANPHADRPNWRPATTLEEYLANVAAGLEQPSTRRLAKLAGVPRIAVYRWRAAAALPEDLFNRLM